MTRFCAALKTDLAVQWRNRLYAIGFVVGMVVAVGLSQLAEAEHFYLIVPALMLIVTGGTTLLYVAAMIIFERDEGTLNAVIVSPLRASEYLWSKIITLTALASAESIVMIGGAMILARLSGEPDWPNVAILVTGIAAIGVIYTLIGIILVARFEKLTDFLMPMAMVAVILQLPFLHFLGVVVHPVFLLIPTSAPTMIMRGAYVDLDPWQWIYAVGYTTVLIFSLAVWSSRSFHRYVVMTAG